MPKEHHVLFGNGGNQRKPKETKGNQRTPKEAKGHQGNPKRNGMSEAQDCTTDRTIIEYMTDGMLLRQFLPLPQRDRPHADVCGRAIF